jgi:phosphopantetheinyl transferase (holo-ACP synthase)
MKETMSNNSDGVTVHTMNPVPGRGPFFYASLSCNTETDGTERAETKQRLISTLWDYHRATTKNPPGKQRQSSNRAAFPIRLVRGPLGKPFLLMAEHRGPAISFSEGGGNLWAAISGDDSDIGIDVAGSDEFREDYPVQRTFHPEELDHALTLTDGDREEASALLWSVKEAVVKALGCAFHLVDPRHITVYPSARPAIGETGGHTFPVRLSGKAQVRFPMAADRSIWVRSLPLDKMWLSIALLNCKPAGHE